MFSNKRKVVKYIYVTLLSLGIMSVTTSTVLAAPTTSNVVSKKQYNVIKEKDQLLKRAIRGDSDIPTHKFKLTAGRENKATGEKKDLTTAITSQLLDHIVYDDGTEHKIYQVNAFAFDEVQPDSTTTSGGSGYGSDTSYSVLQENTMYLDTYYGPNPWDSSAQDPWVALIQDYFAYSVMDSTVSVIKFENAAMERGFDTNGYSVYRNTGWLNNSTGNYIYQYFGWPHVDKYGSQYTLQCSSRVTQKRGSSTWTSTFTVNY